MKAQKFERMVSSSLLCAFIKGTLYLWDFISSLWNTYHLHFLKAMGNHSFWKFFSSVSPRVAFHAAKAWVWHVLLLTVCWTPGHVQNLLKNNRRSDLTMVLRAFSNLPPLFELTKWKHENELKALSLPNRERL